MYAVVSVRDTDSRAASPGNPDQLRLRCAYEFCARGSAAIVSAHSPAVLDSAWLLRSQDLPKRTNAVIQAINRGLFVSAQRTTSTRMVTRVLCSWRYWLQRASRICRIQLPAPHALIRQATTGID